MRYSDEISKEELKKRNELQLMFQNDPYVIALNKMLDDFFVEPAEYRMKTLFELHLGLSSDSKIIFNTIQKELEQYKKNRYSELFFDLEEDEKLEEVKKLKEDVDLSRLISGLKYYTDTTPFTDKEVFQIKEINRQISELRRTKFPKLFKKK
jgi:hypothetical protein